MADQKLRIDVEAETTAAQAAMDDLADATFGLAKASDKASTEQQKLQRATAETTAKVNAAREAAARAQKTLAEHTAVVQAFGKDSAEAAASLARLKAAEEAASKATREAERALEATGKAVAEAARNADEKATPALRRMADSLQAAGRAASATASDLRALEAKIETAAGGAKGLGAAFASFKGNVAAMAVGALAGKLGELGMHALSTAASFESMKTALASTLGSQDEAAAKFAELQKFAAATPFSLEQATQGFLKLKNLGLDPSERAMRSYGDIAGATGKTMMDVVEAVADAAQGEGERLKEFGIRMSKDGDRIRLTFRGVTEEMKFDSKEIEQYLIRLGETNFAGGMEAQSRTLGGLWSTMQDGFDQFLVSVMDSGITQALKSIMGDFTGMGETGKLLSNILGVTLGGAMTVLAGAVKVTTVALELFSTAVNFILSPIGMVADAASAAAADLMDFEEASKAAAEAQAEADRQYWESAKGTGSLASDLQGLIDLSGQYASSVLAEATAHLEAEGAASRRLKAEADLWDKLAQAQAKAEEKAIFDQFEKANEMGPALPPGFKKPDRKKKGKKDKEVEQTNREIDFWAGAGASVGEDVEGKAAAFEAESEARDARLADIDRELAALDALGVREAERIDLIFATVEIEDEAAARREAIIDRQLAKEEELARWQVEQAVTEAQRERARTRLLEAEDKKRLRSLKKSADAEKAEHAKREKAVGAVVGAVTTLGEGMVSAFERMAAGEKGAIASMIAELLKGVAKKHAILALGEAALGVGAAASYRYAAAAQHFTAAGLHTGVAVAAGVGAAAAGAIAEARQGGGAGGGGRTPFGAAGSESAPLPGDTGRMRPQGQGRSNVDDVEQLEVPISHEQARRGDARMPAASAPSGPAVVVHVNGPLVGQGGMEELSKVITLEQAKATRTGRRPRP